MLQNRSSRALTALWKLIERVLAAAAIMAGIAVFIGMPLSVFAMFEAAFCSACPDRMSHSLTWLFAILIVVPGALIVGLRVNVAMAAIGGLLAGLTAAFGFRLALGLVAALFGTHPDTTEFYKYAVMVGASVAVTGCLVALIWRPFPAPDGGI